MQCLQQKISGGNEGGLLACIAKGDSLAQWKHAKKEKGLPKHHTYLNQNGYNEQIGEINIVHVVSQDTMVQIIPMLDQAQQHNFICNHFIWKTTFFLLISIHSTTII